MGRSNVTAGVTVRYGLFQSKCSSWGCMYKKKCLFFFLFLAMKLLLSVLSLPRFSVSLRSSACLLLRTLKPVL